MFFFSAADPVEQHCNESDPGYRIETYRTPTGDGNKTFISFSPFACSIETYRTPTGDGNLDIKICISNMERIETYRTPTGDGNHVRLRA